MVIVVSVCVAVSVGVVVRGSHGVCLGGGIGCGVCLYGSGGHGVCWGRSGGFCQYASRGVVCWGSVGSGVDSNIVSGAGIVGMAVKKLFETHF